MEKLEIERKSNTPAVIFDPETGNLKIEGRSIPENPGDFYDSEGTVKGFVKDMTSSQTEIQMKMHG